MKKPGTCLVAKNHGDGRLRVTNFEVKYLVGECDLQTARMGKATHDNAGLARVPIAGLTGCTLNCGWTFDNRPREPFNRWRTAIRHLQDFTLGMGNPEMAQLLVP